MTLPEPVARVLSEMQLTPQDYGRCCAVTLPGTEAFGVWKQLANAARGSGVWPVILGEASHLDRLNDLPSAGEARAVIEESEAVDASIELEGDADAAHLDPELGEWPAAADVYRQTAPTAVADVVTQTPHASVAIAILPAAAAWQVPAVLGFGGWNDCPEATLQVARHRDWEARFGAEVCAVTNDTLECFVARPPETREEALKLAREQYVYCYDIVEQGTETLSNLAATLLNGPIWFFWWD